MNLLKTVVDDLGYILKKNGIDVSTLKSFETVLKKISTKDRKIICVFGSLYQCGNILNKN